MNIISLKVAQLLSIGRMNLNAEQQTFVDANKKRVDALLYGVKAGESFSQLKQMFLSAPNKNTLFETDIGTFTGWLDFLNKQNLSRTTVDNYIFLYEHSQELKELRLISKEPEDLASGAAGHRKIAAIKAVKWYLKRIKEEGEHIRGTLTACDFQEFIQSKAKEKVEEEQAKLNYKKLYEELSAKYSLMELRLRQLELELSKYKEDTQEVKRLTRTDRI